jgi:hypothetical protein
MYHPKKMKKILLIFTLCNTLGRGHFYQMGDSFGNAHGLEHLKPSQMCLKSGICKKSISSSASYV